MPRGQIYTCQSYTLACDTIQLGYSDKVTLRFEDWLTSHNPTCSSTCATLHSVGHRHLQQGMLYAAPKQFQYYKRLLNPSSATVLHFLTEHLS